MKPDPDRERAEKGAEVLFHGIDPVTGDLLRPPRVWSEIRDCVIATFRLRETLPDVTKKMRRAEAQEARDHRGRPPAEVDPKDLASAGWGVIFADGVEPAVKEALEPLVMHRKAQAGDRYKRFEGHLGLKAGVRAIDWLSHLKMGPGAGNVDRVPYYLMVVGDPDKLPFDLEFDFNGSNYAVGRLAFESPEEYARYAENVIAAETEPACRPPRLTFVGMEHPRDHATQLCQENLVRPLLEHFRGTVGWRVSEVLGEAATKTRVGDLLGGGETPSVLFLAGHGTGPRPRNDPGRILCAPWEAGEPVTEEHTFGADDLSPMADLRGLVAILFGCFTAGMPSHDSFCFVPPRPLGAGKAMMSKLAGRLLSHERGALAVVGHVDRAWSYSYTWNQTPQPHTFRSVLTALLLKGEPVGAAAAYLSGRYNDCSRELLRQMSQVLRGESFDEDSFVIHWMAERDARGYLVYGDPAVRPWPRHRSPL
jgi:hypothetical protein